MLWCNIQSFHASSARVGTVIIGLFSNVTKTKDFTRKFTPKILSRLRCNFLLVQFLVYMYGTSYPGASFLSFLSGVWIEILLCFLFFLIK